MIQMYAIVKMAVDKLDQEEKAAMQLCVAMGTNPVGRLGYEKIKSLFTEQGGTKMHKETEEFFMSL